MTAGQAGVGADERAVSSGGADADANAGGGTGSGSVMITFDYKKQSGSASNQFAVWIEDMGGNMVKTLYATRFTANGGYKNRPDSIAVWVEKSGLANMSKPEVDAITGATPGAGTLKYEWDLTGADGLAVPPGEYMFFVEGTLRWKNRVIYSGAIRIGDAPASVQADTPVSVQADAVYTYEESGKNAALTADAPENGMIGSVTANYMPAPYTY